MEYVIDDGEMAGGETPLPLPTSTPASPTDAEHVIAALDASLLGYSVPQAVKATDGDAMEKEERKSAATCHRRV